MNWPLALLVSLLTADPRAADPRIALVELQIEQTPAAALAAVDKMLSEQPELAQKLGIDYLRGHLLLQLERRQEASDAFIAAMNSTPQLSAYSRFRLATEQAALGHPEVAAGLIATLLAAPPPKPLVEPAVNLFTQTLEQGGDCRLLRQLNPLVFAPAQKRQLILASLRCARQAGDLFQARQGLVELLEEDRRDDVAWQAAALLRELEPAPENSRWDLLIGLSFHNHREFARAIEHLSRVTARLPQARGISPREAFESRYALARSHFWEERFALAADLFGALASTTTDPSRRAQALYQQGRCFELLDSWDVASAVFQRVYQAEPGGSWADAAVISYLRLQWLLGHENEALQAYQALLTHREYKTAARALLFFASSDLAQNRTDRALAWLTTATQLDGMLPDEVAYWRGRLFELQKQVGKAVREYARTLEQSPYSPFGRAAKARLLSPGLRPAAEALSLTLAATGRLEDLTAAWLLLSSENPRAQLLQHHLTQKLLADPGAAPFLRIAPQPLASWQLWKASLLQPEEQLLALGLFREGAPALPRYFPSAQPALAITGSQVLAQAGEFNRSLYLAEVLSQRIPKRVPSPLLPQTYRRLLFPMGFGLLIARESQLRGIDPFLLAAIIREESRFDPSAFSSASARGLTQFVFPTAVRLAAEINLELDSPAALEQPPVAIALGALYLRQLKAEFQGNTAQIVAAYNAGEPQAALWRRYCFSDDPAEYLSKVAFKETRAYLRNVLTSHVHYRELYAAGNP